MGNNIGYEFTLHALDQMSLRIGSTLNNEGRVKIQDYMDEIDKYEAYLLIGDESLAGSFNKNTSYYRIDCRDAEVAGLFIDYGARDNLVEGQQFVLVVRDDLVITFKTTLDKMIYSNLKRFDRSYKKEKVISRCMDSHWYTTPDYIAFVHENKEHVVDHVVEFLEDYIGGRKVEVTDDKVYLDGELYGELDRRGRVLDGQER